MSKQHVFLGSVAMHAFSFMTIAIAFVLGATICGDRPSVAWAGMFVPNVVMQLFVLLWRGHGEMVASQSSAPTGGAT